MPKLKTIDDMWEEFSAFSLKDASPNIVKMTKITYYKALSDVLAYQHNVLGDSKVGETLGALTMQGWFEEVNSFLSSLAPDLVTKLVDNG